MEKSERHLAHLMSCRIAVQFASASLTVSRYGGIDCVFAQHKGVQKYVPGLVFGFGVFSFLFGNNFFISVALLFSVKLH